MTEITSYEPGTPCWVDLASGDPDASASFYEGLFGWKADLAAGGGGYMMLVQDGKNVAGLGPVMMEGQPEQWSTYVSVADADAAAAAVTAAGGVVLAPPMDVMGFGRMAVFLDDGGAAICVWQPGTSIGAQVVNEPVSLTWNELNSRDIDKSKAFYAKVFGWEGVTSQMGPMTYTEWKLTGNTIGGMMEMGPQFPADAPAHWLVYFAVADTDATVAKATELGGSITVPPMDIPPGRFAVLADSRGATFAVIKMAST